jgi:F0F1-type ATP synthase membrane subunit c/vacuolar-type H+-ATPase subunit K
MELVAEFAPAIAAVDARVKTSPAYIGRAILVASGAFGCAIHVGGIRGGKGNNAC